MKKIKTGDIFEINTPKGNAYLHFICEDKVIGELIRVLPNLYSERPEKFDDLVSKKERYMIFFPLSAAVRKKIIELVGFYPINNFSKPQYMRTEFNIRGERIGWHIVDTNTWQRQLVKELNLEQIQFSPWGIWNDTLLIEKLVGNWNLENWK